MAEAVKPGSSDLFLSQKELSDYDTITHLLWRTQRFGKNMCGKVYNHSEDEAIQKQEKNNLRYKKLEEFVHILARDNEVMAAVLSFRRGVTLFLIHEERPLDATEGTGQGFRIEESPELSKQFMSRVCEQHSLELDSNTSISRSALEQVVKENAHKQPTDSISHEHHCSNIMKLIKQTHEAHTRVEIHNAINRLSFYVYLSSVAKILDRLKRGGELYKRTILPNLSCSATEIARRSRRGRPFGFKAISLFDRLNQDQLICLRGILRLLLRSEQNPHLTLLQRKLDDGNFSFYDLKEGRFVLQTLVSLLVKGCFSTVAKVNSLKTRTLKLAYDVHKQTEELKQSTSTDEAWLKALQDSFSKALKGFDTALLEMHRTLSLLEVFLQCFEKILKEHFRWIADMCKLRTIKQAPQPYIQQTRPSDTLESKLEEEISTDDPSHLEAATLDAQTDPPSTEGWAQAAFRYLELVCRHSTAIRGLSNVVGPDLHQRTVSTVVKQASFKYISVRPNITEAKLPPLYTFLKDFTRCSGQKLNEHDIEKILKHVSTNDSSLSDRPRSPSAHHLETILASLQLLSHQRAQLTQPINNVTLPAIGFTDYFAKLAWTFALSRPLCPSCNQLMHYLVRSVPCGILHARYHNEWSSCTLPPWIPADAGRHVIDFAVKELRVRIDSILEIS